MLRPLMLESSCCILWCRVACLLGGEVAPSCWLAGRAVWVPEVPPVLLVVFLLLCSSGSLALAGWVGPVVWSAPRSGVLACRGWSRDASLGSTGCCGSASAGRAVRLCYMCTRPARW